MTERACKNCEFWNKAKRAKWQDVSHGGGSYIVEHAACRRYAPQRLLADMRSPTADKVWPEVNANDWCGEFNPRHPDQKAEGAG
jgi:hypothetical protein